MGESLKARASWSTVDLLICEKTLTSPKQTDEKRDEYSRFLLGFAKISCEGYLNLRLF